MVDKIKKSSWKTSLLGFSLIVSAIASVLVGKADWETAASAIAIGAGFIFTKDSDKQ